MLKSPKLKSPKINCVYNTLEIESELNLLDSPCLIVEYEGNWYPIQTSHLIPANSYLKDKSIATLLWKYQRTTSEWIPIFTALDSKEVLKHCVIQFVLYGDEIETIIQFKGDIRNFIEEAEKAYS